MMLAGERQRRPGGLGMEARVISKVSRRIVPFVALCYFVCYLDRVNVGFAALQMNRELGFTATVFGWGAGIFFFGVPQRYGRRRRHRTDQLDRQSGRLCSALRNGVPEGR